MPTRPIVPTLPAHLALRLLLRLLLPDRLRVRLGDKLRVRLGDKLRDGLRVPLPLRDGAA